MKKLRSLLRLIRPALGTELYRRENRRFRDLGRSLSEARDAKVKLETLEELRERGMLAEDVDEYARALEDERDDAESSEVSLTEVRETLDAARRTIDDWGLDDWTPAGKGAQRAFKRGRKALRAVRVDPSDEAVHEWRKRSKDLWYHLRLLRGSWRAVLDPLADEAHELSDLLGDHHDLAVLADDVKGRRGELPQSSRAAVLAAIRRRQGELLEEALPLGERLYAEKPKAFRRRLDAYWAAAHS